VVAAAAALCLSASVARADDAAAARELFTQGNTFFDLGQFDKAIDAWQRGYQLKNDPGFLYNIGQAYRQMGDPDKAIFFYKRYLANSPKAKNRSEVEQKIEALQKQVQEHQPPAATSGPAAVTPPPAEPPPLNGGSAPPAVSPPPVVAASEPVVPPPTTEPAAVPAAPPARRFDLGVGLGFDIWSSGLRAHADPSFAFTIQAGWTFGNPLSRVRFRLGALLGYTFLKETSGTDTFTSFLLAPTLVVRLTPRLRLMADLGLGAVSISGMTPTSTLLIVPKDTKLTVTGAGVARGVVRIGVGLEYDLTARLSLFFWPAIASSPKTGNFYEQLTRVELLFGAAYRF
jgi:hypothetical protein